MEVFNPKIKFIIALASVFAFVGVVYLTVALLKNHLPESGVRNSTDEIGNRVLLSKADFANDNLDSDWRSLETSPSFSDKKAIFEQEGQVLISPRLNNNFTKYVEINVSEISGGSDSAFLISGYNAEGLLLEEKRIENMSQTKTYGCRFSYDHVFIDYVVFTYQGQEAVLAVDNISIYALQ